MENNKPLTIDEVHKIALEIMQDIDEFCRKNDIAYSLACGTLLGAVRHGGFIPWDDDADLFMLREDYDRFIKTYKSDKYLLRESGYAKVVDTSTCLKKKDKDTEYGVFVDIFPLDHVPEDPELQKKHTHTLMSIHNRIYHRKKKDIISIIKSYRHSLNWWMNKLHQATHDPRYMDSPLVSHAVGSTKADIVVNQDLFKDLVDFNFDGYKFLGFRDTHDYLVLEYGEDYMTPKKWSHDLKIYKR